MMAEEALLIVVLGAGLLADVTTRVLLVMFERHDPNFYPLLK